MKRKSTNENISKKSKQEPNLSKDQKSKSTSPIIKWSIIVGLLLLTLIIFYPMLENQFTNWDDPDYITKNPRITKLNNESINYMFTKPIAYNYHPFTILSLAINYSYSKLNPYSYFLVNLILHLINVYLVFLFIYYLSKKNLNVATFVALIFAIHPMHVESVAWATERKDVLYSLFFVLGLITYLYYLDTKKTVWYYATLILALFSMLSKPAAIIFPLALLAMDYYKDIKFTTKNLLSKIPFFVLAAFFVYMTLQAQVQDNKVIGDYTKYNMAERFLLACYGFTIYIIKFLIPTRLATFHPYPKTSDALLYISPLIILAIIGAIFFIKKSRKLLLFGFAFFLVNLILVLQFYQVGAAIYAERYTYISYLGLAFIAGMLIFDSNKRVNTKIAWVAIGIVSLVFSYLARKRVDVWHDSVTLWTDMIEKYPEDSEGYFNRGNFYSDRGNPQQAVYDYTEALKYKVDAKIYFNRAVAYRGVRKSGKDSLVSLNPSGQETQKIDYAALELADVTKSIEMKQNISSYVFRAEYYIEKSMFAEAVADFDYILSKEPYDKNSLTNRGAALFRLQQYEKAIQDGDKLIKLDPQNPNYYANQAMAYEKLGQKATALEYVDKATKKGYKFPESFLAKLKN